MLCSTRLLPHNSYKPHRTDAHLTRFRDVLSLLSGRWRGLSTKTGVVVSSRAVWGCIPLALRFPAARAGGWAGGGDISALIGDSACRVPNTRRCPRRNKRVRLPTVPDGQQTHCTGEDARDREEGRQRRQQYEHTGGVERDQRGHRGVGGQMGGYRAIQSGGVSGESHGTSRGKAPGFRRGSNPRGPSRHGTNRRRRRRRPRRRRTHRGGARQAPRRPPRRRR